MAQEKIYYFLVGEDVTPTEITESEAAEILGFIPKKPGTYLADDDYFVAVTNQQGPLHV